MNGIWTTYKAIPQGYTLCTSSGTFNSDLDNLLFEHPIRFLSCSAVLDASCPDQELTLCDSQPGFTVSITTTVKTTIPGYDIIQMFQEGELICADGSTTCGIIPPGYQVCPSCTGSCKPTGYIDPCDEKQNVCEDMCTVVNSG